MFRFLSTLSLRRATVEEVSGDTWARDFYPRSPCGERLGRVISMLTLIQFLSTLSLRRATRRFGAVHNTKIFLSTLSLRRATRGWCLNINGPMISIHALLAESDHAPNHSLYLQNNFYPRSPCGERLWPGLLARPFFIISIHALLAESDRFQSFCKSG